MIYHKELGFPKVVSTVIGKTFTTQFSSHAKQSCRNDRYGFIIPPTSISVSMDNIIEIEVEGNTVTKVLIRQKYDSVKDICIAFIPQSRVAFVKTLWLNMTTDKHYTLDETKYNRV